MLENSIQQRRVHYSKTCGTNYFTEINLSLTFDILLQEISEFARFWVYIYITRSLSVWIISVNILRRNAKENFLRR